MRSGGAAVGNTNGEGRGTGRSGVLGHLGCDLLNFPRADPEEAPEGMHAETDSPELR